MEIYYFIGRMKTRWQPKLYPIRVLVVKWK